MRVPRPESNDDQPKVLPPLDQTMPAIVPVNNYIWQRFYESDQDLVNGYDGIPFYPLGTAGAFDETLLTDYRPAVVFYDRLFRYRPQPFYEIRKEQFQYNIVGTELNVMQWQQAIQVLLDGEDDSAKDINEWITWQHKLDIDALQLGEEYNYRYPVSFHSMRAFVPAFNEFRDISNDSSFQAKIIIDLQYHYINYDGEYSSPQTNNFYSLKTPWKPPTTPN